MLEFLYVYATIGIAAFGGFLVKEKQNRTLGVICLSAASALGVVLVVALVQ
ncbi:MAG: hypothetical protein LiPW15_276 [Parcubacteria group bacterium LiPW_15]|nr:MAG: hypothetical protein LiPW15_276 [Parcubacteria group bacterium LiPW_15]